MCALDNLPTGRDTDFGDAEAVVLDFVNPTSILRRPVDQSRQAWIKWGRGSSSADPAPTRTPDSRHQQQFDPVSAIRVGVMEMMSCPAAPSALQRAAVLQFDNIRSI